jgi:hypothetical protein
MSRPSPSLHVPLADAAAGSATGCGAGSPIDAVETCASSGDGKLSRACKEAFSKEASRPCTARSTQPLKSSPVFNRITSRVDGLTQIAIPLSRPTIVPTSCSGISSGAATICGGGAGAATGAGGVGTAARREGEKSGRSRVAVSELSEIPQSGLPPEGGEDLGSPCTETLSGKAACPTAAKPQPALIIANHTKARDRRIGAYTANLWQGNGIKTCLSPFPRASRWVISVGRRRPLPLFTL